MTLAVTRRVTGGRCRAQLPASACPGLQQIGCDYHACSRIRATRYSVGSSAHTQLFAPERCKLNTTAKGCLTIVSDTLLSLVGMYTLPSLVCMYTLLSLVRTYTLLSNTLYRTKIVVAKRTACPALAHNRRRARAKDWGRCTGPASPRTLLATLLL